MKFKHLIKNVWEFLIIGTTPLRLIEGIILNLSLLVLSLYFILFSQTFFIIIISIVCLIAYKHLKTCRILYEIRVDELAAFQDKTAKFHRKVDFILKIFEYYLILYSILLILFFITNIFKIELFSFYFLILLTPFLYIFISIFGHFSRVKAIKRVNLINKNVI